MAQPQESYPTQVPRFQVSCLSSRPRAYFSCLATFPELSWGLAAWLKHHRILPQGEAACSQHHSGPPGVPNSQVRLTLYNPDLPVQPLSA